MIGSIVAAATAVAALWVGYAFGAMHGYTTGVADGRRAERIHRIGHCGVCGEGVGQ